MPRQRYDPFKDAGIPSESDLGRTNLLAGLDPYHPSRMEDEEGILPRPRNLPNRRPGQRLPWAHIASMLAQGHSVESAASLHGCDSRQIWRNLRRSRRFRQRIEQAMARMQLQADLRFRDLHLQTVLQMRHRARDLDPKTLHWLVERLRLGEAPARTADLTNWLEMVARLPAATRKKKAGALMEAENDGTKSA